MKKLTKKLVGLIAVGAMTASFAQPYVSAAREDFSCDFNAEENRVIGESTINLYGEAANNIAFLPGLAGRNANDYSAKQTFTDENKESGFQLMHYASEGDTRSKWDRILYECSFMYSGDADYLQLLLQAQPDSITSPKQWKFTCNIADGAVSLSRYYFNAANFKSFSNNLKIEKNQWVRAVLDFNTSGTINLYLNGQKFEIESGRDIYWIKSFTITAGFNETGDGSKTGVVAIDDVKVTRLGYYTDKSEYVPTGDQTTPVVCSVIDESGRVAYDSVNDRIVYADDVTAGDVLGAVDTENVSAKIVKSAADFTELTAETAVGKENVLILTSKDGGTFKYIKMVDADSSRIVHSDSMSASSYFTLYGTGKAVKGTACGQYTKESDDYSYTITSSGEDVTYRTEYMPAVNSEMFKQDSFTYEFSVAMDGVLSEVKAVNYFSAQVTDTDDDGNTSVSTTERFAYVNPVTFRNGRIYVNDNGKEKFVRNYRNREWYRVGVTIYPKELKCDIYVNGVKEISKGWAVNYEYMRNPEKYQFSDFYWNNIAVGFSGMCEGKVSIDDTLLYTGEHFAADAYAVSINPETLKAGTVANDIYLEESMDIADIAEGLNIDADVDTAVYADNTYANDAEDMAYGNVFVLTSKNGLVKEYYTICPVQTKIANKITCYVDGKEGKTLPNKTDNEYSAKITVLADAFVPEFQKDVNGCLILAVYKNGTFVDMEIDDKVIISDTDFKAEYEISDPEGITVKAFFVNSLDKQEPYAASEIFSQNEVDSGESL